MSATSIVKWLCLVFIFVLALIVAFFLKVPDEGRLSETSKVLRAVDGSILERRLTSTGHWREPVKLNQIDPQLLKILIAYEDKRFWQHHGVDFLAIGRAVIDGVKAGRVVSGASTLTMQTVRLMHPQLGGRNVFVKLEQMLEALRLEAHWSKEKILEAYFTLAPYGGNVEGIRAASNSWFDKEPLALTPSEAAFLVALPQSPEMRRPDRFPDRAHRAKAHVLQAVSKKFSIDKTQLGEFVNERLPTRRSTPKSLAPHLMDRLSDENIAHNTTVVPEWQKAVNDIMIEAVLGFEVPTNAAALVVERKTGRVRAYVGSSDYLSEDRKGGINYLLATRSPGSTLKPFICAKALQRNLITPDEIFEDTPVQVAGYAPGNFDQTFSGQVGLEEALARSLNIPAITTLERLNPDVFEHELRNFLDGQISHRKSSGLSLAVGGFYMTAEDLAQLYLEFADPGEAGRIVFNEAVTHKNNKFLFEQASARTIQDLLIQHDRVGNKSAFKTGTSHNRQDAWTIRLTKNHITLVWLGTPDNEPTKNLTGRNAAYPLTDKIIDALGLLEPTRFDQKSTKPVLPKLVKADCSRLIQFPEDGEWIRSENLHLAVAGDRAVHWYVNGVPIEMKGSQIVLPKPGAHKISARKRECIQTNEIFLDLQEKKRAGN